MRIAATAVAAGALAVCGVFVAGRLADAFKPAEDGIVQPWSTGGSAATSQPRVASMSASAPDAAATSGTPSEAVPSVIVSVTADGAALSGVVGSEHARTHLAELIPLLSGVSSSAVRNELRVDETLVDGVGVRIVDITPAAFEPGQVAVQAPLRRVLDRYAAVMTALRATTVVVVGHDDRPDAFDPTLGAQRAQEATARLESQGVDPARVSSRAAGPDDLAQIAPDELDASLGGRVHVIFFGII